MKNSGVPHPELEFPLKPTLVEKRESAKIDRNAGEQARPSFDFSEELDRILLAHFAPNGLVTNGDFDIVHFQGQTGPYLEPVPDEASLNLLKILRHELIVDVRTAVATASKSGQPARREGVRFDFNRQVRNVIDTLAVQQQIVPDKDGNWFSLRIRPYRTAENKIEGVVIVLVDIDEPKRAIEEIMNLTQQPVVLLSPDLQIVHANKSFYENFKLTSAEAVNRRTAAQLEL